MNGTATTPLAQPAPRLALLLVVSLLLHLLLLWLVHTPSQVTASSGPLHVTLVNIRSSEAAAATPVAHGNSVPKHVAQHAPQVNAQTESAAPHPVTESTPSTAELFAMSTGTSEQALYDMGQSAGFATAAETEADAEAIRAQIYTRFAEHFHYPPLAQQRNWQGTVVLAFRVASDGSLNDIEVVESSGFALLDEAAVKSLRAIGRVQFTPGSALRQTLELRMPVVYRLAQW